MTVAEAIKARDEYIAEYTVASRIYNEQCDALKEAVRVWTDRIENRIREELGCDYLSIKVNSWLDNSFEARISNETYPNRETASLVWSMDINVKDGELRISSNSWSGADFTTAEKIADMEESIKIIKKIHAIDWVELAKDKKPDYKDYVTARWVPNETNKYVAMVEEAIIEETMAERKIIKVVNRCTVDYISIVKATEKQYRYTAYTLSKEVDDNSKMYDMLHEESFVKNAPRMSKENFKELIGKKYEIIDC